MVVSRFGRRLASAAAAAAGALVLALLPYGTAYAASSITVSGLASGQYVGTGTSFSVTASATTTDTATSIRLLIDGNQQDTQPCTGGAGDPCEATLTFDPSSLTVAAHSAVVELVTDAADPAATSTQVIFNVGANPTASMLTDTGTFVVTAGLSVRGTTDPAGADYPASFQLVVGGSDVVGASTGPCASNARDCTTTILWNTTGLSTGNKSVQVRMTTSLGVVRLSAAVTLRVAAAPTATISSPASGAQHVLPNASDVVTVTATGSSDSGLGGTTKVLELFLDGGASPVATVNCASGTGSTNCSNRALTWDASAAAGASQHTATVRVTVSPGGQTAESSVTFRLAEEPSVTVVAPGAGLNGADSITITAQTDALTAEDPQSVVLRASNAIDPAIVFDAVTCDSAPVDGACTFTVPWDVSTLSGSYNLQAELTTTTGRTRTSLVTSATIQNNGPVMTVTAPTATVLKGRVTVSGAARIGTKVTGYIKTLTLFAGGKQVGTTKTCSALVTLCTYSAVWDTTTLANAAKVPIQLQVTTSSTGAQEFNSVATLVTLRNPRPSATFTSPGNGAVVSGSAVTIKVGLKTDATQSDVPKSAAIYRNGSSTPFDTYTCSGGTHACLATFTWNASRSAGVSSFVVKVRTSKNRTGASSVRKLYASSLARLTMATFRTVDNGTRVRVSGRLVAVRTGLPIAGQKVAIERDPAIGSTVRGTVTTSSTGRFSITFIATSNTRITARSVSVRTPLGGIYIPAAAGAASQTVRAPMTCRVLASVVRAGQKGTGRCGVPGLPFGTPLTLRYTVGGTTRTLATGTSSGSLIPFVYQFPKKGFYQLRVSLSGNKAYAATSSGLMSVTVR
ncbi:MAG: hypothetical protein AB7O74_05780 [Candidatus Nanopelagicales bacterium]